MQDMSAALSAGDNGHHIAVIGMTGRFPGAPDIDRFWQNLIEGVESIQRWSKDDLLAKGVRAEQIDLPDFVPASGPLEGADRFDAEFFGYSPAEAEILDPQQRIFLECAWHALETAGYTGDRYRRAIGVFAAAGINTYLLNLHDNARISETVSPYELFVANDKDFLATRTAFKLNLRGPAVTVQTACSSSLVAVHMAAQSLLSGDCDMALAGGIALSQSSGYRAREGGILSGDGHCRAFDAHSAGTVPGSGVGIVVLKRLEDAIADGDAIDAVILGSAINNDGALKASFTAPQVDSQAAVIADAQAMAGVRAESIGYVEAHGTGTALGDPIEVAALTQAFRRDTPRHGFCALGSVKTNIGHLDTAAGIAGFIKAVLTLKHGRIPPSLHYRSPNPQIDFDASPFFVNARLRDWDNDIGVRRAGVSSFGIGGTNAHVVLEEPPARPASTTENGPRLLVLSARNPAALSKSAMALADRLESPSAPALADVAFTLGTGRRDFNHRQFVVAGDAKTAAARLRSLSDFSATNAGAPSDAVFLFPGQGSQYPAMGKALYAGLPIFRARFDDCAAHLDKLLNRDVRGWLFAGEETIHRTDLAQPALFALEYALAQTWISFGVTPRALHGHSIGEYVAACLAGVFDLDTALALVVERGRLMQSAAPGAMLAVIHPDRPIDAWLSADVSLAAANAPGLSVVSGAADAIADVQKRLKEQGIASRLLKTSHAFHSPMMGDAAEAFRAILKGVRLAAPQIPLISNVTGTWMTDEQATDPDYWVRHLLEPVRFEAGTRTLLTLPAPLFMEVGPGRTLGTFTAETGGAAARLVATLGEGDRTDEAEQALAGIGRYWQLNGKLDPTVSAGHRVALPTYPFQSERYWVQPDGARSGRAPEAATREHGGAELYRTTWRRAPLQTVRSPKLKGRFLVFDEGRIGTVLANELERSGAEPYRAVIGERFDEPDYRCFTLGEHALDDYANLLAALDERGAAPDHVVFAWPLDAETDGTRPDSRARTLLTLVRALAQNERRVGLTVLTRSAADVTGVEALDVAQALIGGTMQVTGQENPQLSCRHIDVDSAQLATPETLARRIRDELDNEHGQVALRGAHRWLPETERFDAPEQGAQPALRRNGVYAVVGNIAEGVGKTWVDELSRLPGARLALLHDTQSPPFKGVDCLEHRLDCTDAAALATALDAVAAELGKIDGIFLSMPQSNGKSAAMIAEMPDAHWSYNIVSKLSPLRALIAAVEKRKVGFCCIQSSLSTMIGGLGLSAYAATHHAVDLLVAEQNRAGVTPWFAIGYPLIEDGPEKPLQSTGRSNAFAVSSATAWDLTKGLIESGHSGQTMISGGPIPPAGTATAEEESPSTDGGRSRPALAVAFLAPRNPIEASVAKIFEELLGLERVGVNDGFYELGGHSLLAIRAVAKLRDAFPVDVAMRELLFDNPTAAAIAETISARMAEKTDLSALTDLLDEVDTLSDDDVSRLLAGSDVR